MWKISNLRLKKCRWKMAVRAGLKPVLRFAGAGFANFAQKFERKNARLMAVAEIDLIGVVSDREHGGAPNRPASFGFGDIGTRLRGNWRRLRPGSIRPDGA